MKIYLLIGCAILLAVPIDLALNTKKYRDLLDTLNELINDIGLFNGSFFGSFLVAISIFFVGSMFVIAWPLVVVYSFYKFKKRARNGNSDFHEL
jgi:hypothetical protein